MRQVTPDATHVRRIPRPLGALTRSHCIRGLQGRAGNAGSRQGRFCMRHRGQQSQLFNASNAN
eukprot:6429828-Alexandrium_andersonii.AAC.1